MINLLYKDIRIPLVKEIDFTKSSGKGSTIQYLTQWQMLGNSEVHGNEIWSCGELGEDTKYHIYVSSNGKVFDIALTEPLRKVNSIADKIEFEDGVATVTRLLSSVDLGNFNYTQATTGVSGKYRYRVQINSAKPTINGNTLGNLLCAEYTTITAGQTWTNLQEGISMNEYRYIAIYDANYDTEGTDTKNAFVNHLQGVELIYELATPTTELVDAPQIEVSPTDTYTCVISQGAKAVSWSSFETELD